jgi:hypothetical protein
VTADILAVAARNKDPGTFSLLVEKRAPEVEITTEILIAAQDGPQPLKTTEELLDSCGPQFPIGEELMKKVASDSLEGLAVLRMFLVRQQAGSAVSETVLCAATSSKHQPQKILELLMANGGSNIPLTENVVLAAVSNGFSSGDLLKYLFSVHTTRLPITERVLLASIRSAVALEVILRMRPETRVTTDMFLEDVHHEDAMSALFQQPYDVIPILDMLEIVKNIPGHPYVLRLLLEENLVRPNEDLLELAASNPRALSLLLTSDPSPRPTQKVVLRAAESKDAMNILLRKQADDITITEDVMMVAVAPSSL